MKIENKFLYYQDTSKVYNKNNKQKMSYSELRESKTAERKTAERKTAERKTSNERTAKGEIGRTEDKEPYLTFEVTLVEDSLLITSYFNGKYYSCTLDNFVKMQVADKKSDQLFSKHECLNRIFKAISHISQKDEKEYFRYCIAVPGKIPCRFMLTSSVHITVVLMPVGGSEQKTDDEKNLLVNNDKHNLLPWVKVMFLNWSTLSKNPNAIHMLKEEEDKAKVECRASRVDWYQLSLNTAAFNMLRDELKLALKENREPKVNWSALSKNPNAIELLMDEITRAEAKNQPSRIDWDSLAENSAAQYLLVKEYKMALEEKRATKYSMEALQKNPKFMTLCDNMGLAIENSNLNWDFLSANPGMADFLNDEYKNAKVEKRQSLINWKYLSANSSMMRLINKEIDDSKRELRPSKICWKRLSSNPSAIARIQDKYNTSVRKNLPSMIDWSELSSNPGIFK